LHYQGRPLAIVNLAVFMKVAEPASLDQQYGLLIELENQATLVLIDGLAGIRETVVKSLGSHLRGLHGISGGTISGDGQVVLILDLPELIGSERPAFDDHKHREPLPPPNTISQHVLVVDDSLSVRRVICSFLERMGWQTTSARDGIDALEKLSGIRPDVALVDIEMPRMNGYELLSRIKSDPAFHNIPVVFLTSRSAAKHRERAAQLNVDGYLVKPYQENQLIAELRRVIQVRHA
jgi:chemosensory pili system protein ChpA (sensor histidine kinase/response regulator)